MDDDNKKDKERQEFIVETPLLIEENVGKNSDKVKKYERGKFLGKGGFARCYEMKCLETNKIYAAKVFEKKALINARSKKKLINEIKLHKKLHHQNIVNFEHFFEDNENVYILLELCNNQTLNEILKRRKRLTEIEVQCYLIQIIKALKYIHNHKIIHRDLKLGNCFITGKLELKLGDFGLAAKLEYEGQRRKTVCGTPNYIAPEILEKKNGHSFEVDVWSLGVVAYTLLFGRPPYETTDVKLTYKRIKMNSFTFPENIKVHPSAKKLISSILNLDPSKRPSIDAIIDHEFFRIYNSVPVVLPLSTLACPPSSKYISQFSKNEANYLNHNNSFNMNNSVSNLEYRFTNINNHNIFNEVNDLNNNINVNSAENINMSKDIIKRLLHGNQIHKKSESLSNLSEENLIEKFNQILQTAKNPMNNTVSRNIDKNVINLINSDQANYLNNKKEINEDLISVSELENNNQNIINNNFFINVSNLNNVELKLDESLLKKLEENPIVNQLNLLANGLLIPKNSKKLFVNKITKYYDHSNKFGMIYFINNSHICICFNDKSNMLKNVSIDLSNTINSENSIQNKNLQIIYVEKDGKNTINYDEGGFENYIKNSKTASKDIVKKFEILKHVVSKHYNDITSIGGKVKASTKIFFVKKFLKVQNAIMFRLSNKLVQVCFLDKSELVLCTESNDFYYKDKDDLELFGSIQNVMNSENSELVKRIKFTKNLLIHFVKNQKSKKIPK